MPEDRLEAPPLATTLCQFWRTSFTRKPSDQADSILPKFRSSTWRLVSAPRSYISRLGSYVASRFAGFPGFAARWRSRPSSALRLPDSYPVTMPGPIKEAICIVSLRIAPTAVGSNSSVFSATANWVVPSESVSVENYAPVRDDHLIRGYPSKLEIIQRPATENIAGTLTEVGLVIDERVVLLWRLALPPPRQCLAGSTGWSCTPSGAPRMTDNSPSSNPSVLAASRLLVFRMPTAGTSRTTSEASPDWRSTKRLLHLSLDILKAQGYPTLSN